MSDIVVAEAQATKDMFDSDTSINRSFDQLIDENDAQRKQQLMSQFQQAAAQPNATFPLSTTTNEPSYNPYPASMHQKVLMPTGASQPAPTPAPAPQAPVMQGPIQPASAAPARSMTPPPARPMNTQPSPDIMRLANTKDLSISALAHEAHRLEGDDEGEVVISLR
jgi:hypothetical protein